MSSQSDANDAYLESIDAYLKAIDEHYRKGSAFNHTVVAIGYGSFFALWSFMSNKISLFVADFVAVALALSAFSFVAWEVYRMISEAWVVREVRSQKHATQFDEMNRVKDAVAKHERMTDTPYLLAFTFSVTTGFLGGAILIIAFIVRILTHRY